MNAEDYHRLQAERKRLLALVNSPVADRERHRAEKEIRYRIKASRRSKHANEKRNHSV